MAVSIDHTPPFLIEANSITGYYYDFYKRRPLVPNETRNHKEFIPKFKTVCDSAKEYVKMKFPIEADTFIVHLDNKMRRYFNGGEIGLGIISLMHNFLIDTYKDCIKRYENRYRIYDITKRFYESINKEMGTNIHDHNPPFLIAASRVVRHYSAATSGDTYTHRFRPLGVGGVWCHKQFIDRFKVVCDSAKEYVKMNFSPIEADIFVVHLDNRMLHPQLQGHLTGIGRISFMHNILIDTYKECIKQYENHYHIYEITKKEIGS